MRRFVLRLIAVFRRDRAERDLDREIDTHLALIEEDLRASGMTAAEARRKARLELGGIEQTKELHRDARSFPWLDDLRRDLLQATRLLRRNPVFTLTAALSLAIGISANTTVFTIANALFFREPTGVVDPHRLVDIGVTRENGRGLNPTSYPNYLDLRERAVMLEGVYATSLFSSAMSLAVDQRSGAERIFASVVTLNYFTVLGARPSIGRLFGAGDSEQPNASPIVVLSHRFWTRRFAHDPAVVGRTVLLNSQPFTIVGIAAEGFQGTGVRANDLWMPVTTTPGRMREPAAQAPSRLGAVLMIGARMKPGVTISQAAAEVAEIGRTLAREYPDENRGIFLRAVAMSAVPGMREPIGLFIALLMGMVSIVLFITCANLAGVLLARGATRRQEIAVRLAIGAGRARLVRQLLTETLLLFVLGGAAGLLVAREITSLIVSLLPTLPFSTDMKLALDARVIAFTAGLALVAALLSGLVPALQASRADVVTALKDDAMGVAGRSRLRHGFVIAQVAFSILLVVIAGLFARALQRAGSMSPGFDARGVELASLDLSLGGYNEATGRLFLRDLIGRVRQLPAVERASLAVVLPGGFEGVGLGGVSTPEAAATPGTMPLEATWNVVEPDYFSTIRMPLVAGRDFTDADRADAPAVAIIGAGAARRLFPGQDAVGRFIAQQEFSGPGQPATVKPLLIVGVAGDPAFGSLIDGTTGVYVYLPLQQQHFSRLMIVARPATGQRITSDLRALVASMNPNLPIVTSQTAEDYVGLGLLPQRIAMSFSGSLGLIGLLLAAIGIYGVTAHAVARRTREIGIRIALGARQGDTVRMVLRQGLSLAAIGSGIGLLLAAAASQAFAPFLVGVPPIDPPTFIGAAVLFAIVGATGCYVPARRATRIDPLQALRHE